MVWINPEIKAQTIIEELEIRHPSEIDVSAIAIERGAYVRQGALPGAEARLVRKGNIGIITLSTKNQNEARQRFSIGHELGHFELHKDLIPVIFCTSKDMNDWGSQKKQETEANQFSAALLMPESLFSPMCKGKIPGWDLIEPLSQEFKTSLTATTIRYVKTTREPCAVIYSVNGLIVWQIKSKNFKYFLKGPGEKVDEDSLAYEAFSGKQIPSDGGIVYACTWIKETSWINPMGKIKESTRFFNSYNATLTLLWINEEIEK
ncbi:MAG: ImmA/IrrE family metallo-endopeptidase [bacterium]